MFFDNYGKGGKKLHKTEKYLGCSYEQPKTIGQATKGL